MRMLDRLAPENYTDWRWVVRAGALASLRRLLESHAAVRQALERHPDLTIEGLGNDPSLSDSERQRFIETMRLAGFTPCVSPEQRAQLSDLTRLPECKEPPTTEDRPTCRSWRPPVPLRAKASEATGSACCRAQRIGRGSWGRMA